MSGARRAGHWRANAHMTTVSFWGGVELDLRGAVVESPVIDIRAWVVMGGCEIIVPEGVPVEVDGFILMGGLEDRVRARPGVPRLEGPVIRVHGFGMWGGVTVRTRRTNASGEEVREIAQQMVSDALDRHHERTERRAARHTGMVGGIPGMPGLPGLPPFAQIPEPPAVRMPPLAVPHIPPSPLTNSREPRPNWGPHPPRTPFLAGLGSLIEQFAHVEDAPLAPAPTAPPTLPTGTVTILFTDIAHSTEMAERIGDQRWIGVLGAHNALVRAEIAKHGGTEVKHSGDGFMVVYPSARRALLSAIAIQRSMAEYRKDHPDQPIEVRIGLHTGEVIEEQGDYFGRNVILAARIASSAKGGEILASGLVKELADSGGDLGFDEGHDVELKGMSRPWRVHVVSW